MSIEMTVKARNTLAKAKKEIKRVPEVYRKDLCDSLANKFLRPQDYTFQHSNMAVIAAFHKVSDLYDKLCEVDQEAFRKAFSRL